MPLTTSPASGQLYIYMQQEVFYCDGNMWLCDMLLKNIPNIRVLTYGFDSALEDSKSIASIIDFTDTF